MRPAVLLSITLRRGQSVRTARSFVMAGDGSRTQPQKTKPSDRPHYISVLAPAADSQPISPSAHSRHAAAHRVVTWCMRQHRLGGFPGGQVRSCMRHTFEQSRPIRTRTPCSREDGSCSCHCQPNSRHQVKDGVTVSALLLQTTACKLLGLTSRTASTKTLSA